MIKLKDLLIEGGKGSGRKAGLYTSAPKPKPKKGQRAPKLKQFGEAGLPAMTTAEKNRVISKLHKFDRPRLVHMLRAAADAANRGNARADDLAHIYRDELNNRDRMGSGV